MSKIYTAHRPLTAPQAEAEKAYVIDGKTFIVEPVFKPCEGETVSTILLRLIKSGV